MDSVDWRSGLLRKSFVPPRPIRDLRDLTRCQAMLAREKARLSSRIQKVPEDANIKLASVASDVLGASGRDMLNAIVHGESDANILAEPARKRPRAKRIDELMLPFAPAVESWISIPGVDRVAVWSLVAEIGVDMDQFHSAEHLASWAGVCPKRGCAYQDLGRDYFERENRSTVTRYHVKKLQRLGFTVTLQQPQQA